MLFARSRDGVMQIRLRPEARLDIYEASRFYDRQSDGLGDKFVESIFGDMERLAQLAGIHSKHGRFFRIFSNRGPIQIQKRRKCNHPNYKINIGLIETQRLGFSWTSEKPTGSKKCSFSARSPRSNTIDLPNGIRLYRFGPSVSRCRKRCG